MSKRTFGILAHKPYRQSHLVTVLGTVGIYVLIAAFIRKVNSKNIQPWALPVATLLYLSGLLITNHGIYVYSNKIDLAVQGRYWLPVLLPFSIFVASMYKYEEFMKRRTIIGVVPYAFLVAGIMLGPVSIIYGIKGLGWVYIPKMLFSL